MISALDHRIEAGHVQIPRRSITFSTLGRLGRLGNQLFQIAATIGAAHRLDCAYFFPPWEFAGLLRKTLPMVPLDHMRTWSNENKLSRFRETGLEYREIDVCPPADIIGFFQSERYFNDITTEIRSLIHPNQSLNNYINDKYSDIIKISPWSMHVRRGDYVGDEKYVQLWERSYYENALSRKPPDVPVLIFSDDLEWCRGRFKGDMFYFAGEQHPLAAIFLMSRCAGHIIANSSFSWWGAWLGETPATPIMAPAAWYGPGFKQVSDLSAAGSAIDQPTNNIIPARWTMVSVDEHGGYS